MDTPRRETPILFLEFLHEFSSSQMYFSSRAYRILWVLNELSTEIRGASNRNSQNIENSGRAKHSEPLFALPPSKTLSAYLFVVLLFLDPLILQSPGIPHSPQFFLFIFSPLFCFFHRFFSLFVSEGNPSHAPRLERLAGSFRTSSSSTFRFLTIKMNDR